MNLYKFAAYTRPTPTCTQYHTRVINVAAHGSTLNDAETRALELLGTAPGKREWVLELQGIETTPRPLPDRDEIARTLAESYGDELPAKYASRVEDADLKAADAVLALLRGENETPG